MKELFRFRLDEHREIALRRDAAGTVWWCCEDGACRLWDAATLRDVAMAEEIERLRAEAQRLCEELDEVRREQWCKG